MTASSTRKAPIQRYVKVSGDDFSDLWFDAYGWIACYFAQLEGLSYSLIERLAASTERERLLKLPFQARTERAKELVCGLLTARGETGLAAEWEAFLNEAIAAAPLRNKILHNPLSVSLALGDPLQDPEAGIVLVHDAGRTVMKLGLVQQFSQTMLDLNVRMQDLLVRSRVGD